MQLSNIYLQADLGLAETNAQLGKIDAANAHVDKILESRPDFSVAGYRTRILYRVGEHKDHIVAGLLSGGLPECRVQAPPIRQTKRTW